MKTVAVKRCLAAAVIAALAACSAPKKDTAPVAGHKNAPSRSSSAKRHSPYAPAQEDPSKRGDYTAGGLYAPHVADSAPDGLHDVDLIPEPEVKDEPRSRYGNRSPYKVLGKSYKVLDSADGYDEEGTASFYGKKFHQRRTSSLEVYDMYTFSAAHKTLPLPSYARVTSLDNGKSVIVRVNDRGPFHDGRIIDLSYAAAVKLGIDRKGTGKVRVEGLNARHTDTDTRVAAAPAMPAAALASAPDTAIDKLVAALPVGAAAAAERKPEASATPAAPLANTDYRFDMRQDGKPMTVKEFDAWMKARRVSVATGKPGKLAKVDAQVKPVAPEPVAPKAAEASVASKVAEQAPTSSGGGEEVTLQVASFASQQNASRALTMLKGAGIGDARLQDAQVNGQKLWRLRVGPMRGNAATELAGRIAGLGFGQPRVVKD
ncbi:septal ring lytic transglycosylase RlpA family protein [Luteimonas sp. SX5]|uniref:Endolytic peptidoglycan transglycosylase RlpA n=1 Tax=Luteimonas galliterrae TaxID=2940486 RepID=A0ABT0MIZ7_9GAMM|nr:septal ring lytic transglycosylase RlpA family protein [Luteimonas galliterrae]MCL1634861.1 septal ring lytic transglycosylase RlpA family protein [Luteimonas galliterrae]